MHDIPLEVEGLTKAFGGGRDLRRLVPLLRDHIKVEDRTTVVQSVTGTRPS